ncbi:DUF4381 domain-containing protein [Bradyrhizobium sp. USDA 10063]
MQADPLAGLIDIPLPPPVSLLPQTWELRISLAALLALAIIVVWHLMHRHRANRYRREALAELDHICEASNPAQHQTVDRLSVLVRRTALDAFPRESVAPLVGPAWLAFLDRSYGGHEFSDGVGHWLANAPYQRMSPERGELEPLADLIRRWIKVHHV